LEIYVAFHFIWAFAKFQALLFFMSARFKQKPNVPKYAVAFSLLLTFDYRALNFF